MRTHELKTLPHFFNMSWGREKTFEIRENTDRCFQKGDIICLREYTPPDPLSAELNTMSGVFPPNPYSGRKIVATITCVVDYMQKPGYVVLGLTRMVNEGGDND